MHHDFCQGTSRSGPGDQPPRLLSDGAAVCERLPENASQPSSAVRKAAVPCRLPDRALLLRTVRGRALAWRFGNVTASARFRQFANCGSNQRLLTASPAKNASTVEPVEH